MIDVVYGGDQYHIISQARFTVIVSIHSTVTAVSCSHSNMAVNQASTCSVLVKDASSPATVPTGSVLFSLDNTSTATGSLGVCGLGGVNSASASCSLNFTPTGSGTALVDVAYGGDLVHAASFGLVVTPQLHPTTTSVSCSPSSVDVNGSTTCTVTVTDSSSTGATIPTGSVSLTSTGTGIVTGSPCTLVSPTANSAGCQVTYTPTEAGTGTHTITGSYAGDATHSPSSGPFRLTIITPLHPTTTTVSCNTPVVINQVSTCTATVTDTSSTGPTIPSGTVTFGSPSGLYGSLDSSTCDLAASPTGAPTCSVHFTPTHVPSGYPYSQIISASYGGDSTHNGGSGANTVVVNARSTTTTVNCDSPVALPSHSSCTVTITDTSTAGTPITPIATFVLDTNSTGAFGTNCVLSGSGASSSCTVAYTPSVVGHHVITANFPGDGAHSASSGFFEILVTGPTPNTTTTSVLCSPSSVIVNAHIACTATVTDTSATGASTPTGTVTFTSTAAGTFTGSPCTLASLTANSAKCAATYTPAVVGSGSQIISGTYNADTSHASSSGEATVLVATRTTSTTVSCAPSSIPVYDPTTCTVTVSDTSPGTASAPMGTVTFTSNGTGTFITSPCNLGGTTASSATCQLSYTPTIIGTGIHSITGSYGGDAAHATSSDSQAVTVTTRTTTTDISCSPSSVAVDGSTTCTATVTDTSPGIASAPTGSVVFSTGETGNFVGSPCALGTPTARSASCSVTYTPTAIGTGTHAVTGNYGGDTNHATSRGTFSLAVGKNSTTTTVSCIPSAVAVNAPTMCTALVTDTASTGATAPTGTVTFVSSGTGIFTGSPCMLGTPNVNSSSCQVTYTPTTIGTGSHDITSSYGGDASHAISSGHQAVTVKARTTTTTISCVPSSVVVNQATTCTTTITDSSAGTMSAPTGTVTFTSSGTGTFTGSYCTVGTPTTSSASCSVTYTPTVIGTGSHNVTATYGGDAIHAMSSRTTTVTVSKRTTTIVVSCLPTSVPINAPTDCTATVTDTSPGATSTPISTVSFTAGGSAGSLSTNSCTLNSGSCSVNFTGSAAGAATVTGFYGGDTLHKTSTSAASNITVNLRTSSTTLVCTSQVVIGQASRCTATVADSSTAGTPITPTGTVGWTSTGPGSLSTANCTLVASSCSVSFTGSAAGTATITGAYGGDVVHDTSTSAASTIIVNLRTSSTTIVCTSPVTVGQASTCTATVTDSSAAGTSISPTGTVAWTLTGSGSLSTASCTLIGNSCSVDFTGSAAGTTTVTGTYDGDTVHSGSQGSAPVTVTPPAASFDYALSVSPTSALATAGSSVTTIVTATLTSGTAQSVTLTLSVSPNPTLCQASSGPSPCGTLSFFPSSITPTSTGASSTLTISTTNAIPPGIYTLTITGSPAGASSSSTKIILTITTPPRVGCGHGSCSVHSNATLTNVKFAGNTIHLEADGPKGARGYANVTVPQSEIPNIDHLHVFVDNSKLDSSAVTITSDSTNYYIYFTFTYHSPVLIDIQLTASTSILGLDPTLFYALIGLTGIIIAVIAASRKRKKPTSTP